MNTDIAPSTMYARLLGVVATILGLWGLTLTTSQDTVKTLMGMDVNLTHNLLFLVTGLLGLAIGFGFTRVMTGLQYSAVFGVIYAVLGVVGLASGNFDVAGLFGNIDVTGSGLNLVVGIIGIAAWVMSRDHVTEGAA